MVQAGKVVLIAEETVDGILLPGGLTLGNGQMADVPVDTVGFNVDTTVGAQ